MEIATGKVKWFSNVKGYGFIERDGASGEGTDVFVHHTAIEGEGYRTLKGGQEVQFEVIDGPKGLQAQKVRRVNVSQGQAA